MTVQNWLPQAELALAGRVDNPRLEASLIAAAVLGENRSYLLVHPDAEFNELAGHHLLGRRLTGEPLAYILGYREFFGRRYSVGPGVLIPRDDTETVVELALAYAPTGATVLDIGTGSGIVAATLALERPDLRVTACDISPEAARYASRNFLELEARVDLRVDDAFSVSWSGFDLIVSNPPYVSPGFPLAPEVANFEPEVALYAGEAGLAFYQRLAEVARSWLAPNGVLVLEIGYDQAETVPAILRELEFLEARKDLGGVTRGLAFRNRVG